MKGSTPCGPFVHSFCSSLCSLCRRRCLRRSMNWMLGISTLRCGDFRVWSSVIQQQKIHEHTSFMGKRGLMIFHIYHPIIFLSFSSGFQTSLLLKNYLGPEVTTYQMCILMLFNQQSTLSYQAKKTTWGTALATTGPCDWLWMVFVGFAFREQR